jgi:hypothetical protein
MQIDLGKIEDALQVIGQEAFPDNSDVYWRVQQIVERGGFLCVEAEPQPSTVGYPCFRFVLLPAVDGVFVDHGCYCLRGNVWHLLYTTPGMSEDWKALQFDEAA